MPTKPDLTIPVLGHPLAGKWTFVEHATRAFDGVLHSGTCPVTLAGHLLEARLVRGAFVHARRSIELWCMPGASAPEWQVNLAAQAPAAILIAEPQSTTFDHQAKFLDAFASLQARWFVVVGKQDLRGLITPARAFLPSSFLLAPRLEYSGLAPDAWALVRQFLREAVLPSIGQAEYSLDAALAAGPQNGAGAA